jgi:hypothetical protein
VDWAQLASILFGAALALAAGVVTSYVSHRLEVRLLRQRQSQERRQTRLENVGRYALALREYIGCVEAVKARLQLQEWGFDQRVLDAMSRGSMQDLEASWAHAQAQGTSAAARYFLKDEKASLLLRALEAVAMSWRTYAISLVAGDAIAPPHDDGTQTATALMDRLDSISDKSPTP